MWDCEAMEEFRSRICSLKALEALFFNEWKSLRKISIEFFFVFYMGGG